jgi:drug/metabolite transporter (DMT)-like permease
MESGTALYFALAGIFMVSGSGFFNSYGDVAGSLVLAAIWMGTLAKDMPLTGEYSKWHWPEALWRNPVFIKTNAIITAVWGVVFMLQAAAALAGHFDPSLTFLWILLRYLLLVPAFAFTAWFQKWYPAYGSVRNQSHVQK